MSGTKKDMSLLSGNFQFSWGESTPQMSKDESRNGKDRLEAGFRRGQTQELSWHQGSSFSSLSLLSPLCLLASFSQDPPCGGDYDSKVLGSHPSSSYISPQISGKDSGWLSLGSVYLSRGTVQTWVLCLSGGLIVAGSQNHMEGWVLSADEG